MIKGNVENLGKQSSKLFIYVQNNLFYQHEVIILLVRSVWKEGSHSKVEMKQITNFVIYNTLQICKDKSVFTQLVCIFH